MSPKVSNMYRKPPPLSQAFWTVLDASMNLEQRSLYSNVKEMIALLFNFLASRIPGK